MVTSTYGIEGLRFLFPKDDVYVICDAYIDDFITYGKTEDEFVDNLRQVLDRFRKFNLTANPDKFVIGKSSIEIVGHTIDENGLSFSREKLDEVFHCDRPNTGKELQSFLGLANYFCGHVKNYSMLTKPL